MIGWREHVENEIVYFLEEKDKNKQYVSTFILK